MYSACIFFFSSRRRHTRFDCDWSSDVCSSDLYHWRGIQSLRRTSEARTISILHNSWPTFRNVMIHCDYHGRKSQEKGSSASSLVKHSDPDATLFTTSDFDALLERAQQLSHAFARRD